MPPGQGAFSALGMLMADVQHDYSRTSLQALEDLDADTADALFAGMEEEARETLRAEGFSDERMGSIAWSPCGTRGRSTR